MYILKLLFCVIIISLFACEKEEPNPVSKDKDLAVGHLLVGSKWFISRYDNEVTGNSYEPSDTVFFDSDTTYSTNGGVSRKFILEKWSGSSTYYFVLHKSATFGATYWAYPSGYFISDKELNNTVFKENNGATEIRVWMNQLE